MNIDLMELPFCGISVSFTKKLSYLSTYLLRNMMPGLKSKHLTSSSGYRLDRLVFHSMIGKRVLILLPLT